MPPLGRGEQPLPLCFAAACNDPQDRVTVQNKVKALPRLVCRLDNCLALLLLLYGEVCMSGTGNGGKEVSISKLSDTNMPCGR